MRLDAAEGHGCGPQCLTNRERILDETRDVDWEAYDRSVDILGWK
jgi:hypothetical protein